MPLFLYGMLSALEDAATACGRGYMAFVKAVAYVFAAIGFGLALNFLTVGIAAGLFWLSSSPGDFFDPSAFKAWVIGIGGIAFVILFFGSFRWTYNFFYEGSFWPDPPSSSSSSSGSGDEDSSEPGSSGCPSGFTGCPGM